MKRLLLVALFLAAANQAACGEGHDRSSADDLTFLLHIAQPTAVGYASTGVLLNVGVRAEIVYGGCPEDASGPSPWCSGGIQGVSVSLAGQPAAVTISPATALSDENGDAQFVVLVPFGTEGSVIATGGGATATRDVTGEPAASVVLTVDAGSPTNEPTGTVYPVSATVELGDAGVPGTAVAFSVVGTAATIGAASVPTSSAGVAASSVLVPYGGVATVIASAGGTVQSAVLANAPLQIDAGCTQAGAVGAVTSVNVWAAASADGGAVPGLTLSYQGVPPSFAMVQTLGTAITGADGHASATIATDGSDVALLVSGGGASTSLTIGPSCPQ